MMFAMGLKRFKQSERYRYQSMAMISKTDYYSLSNLFQTLEGVDSTIVKTELALWKEKYIDVATVMDEFVDLRGRTVLLRDEVNFENICFFFFVFNVFFLQIYRSQVNTAREVWNLNV